MPRTNRVAHAPKVAPHKIEFYVCKPFNQNRASFENGTMIAFSANSTETVDQFHKIGLDIAGRTRVIPVTVQLRTTPIMRIYEILMKTKYVFTFLTKLRYLRVVFVLR